MFNEKQLDTIHLIAHLFAQYQSSKDARIREVARTCRAVERVCESIKKGARNSALWQAHRTLEQQMKKAIDLYRMKDNQEAPPGWE